MALTEDKLTRDERIRLEALAQANFSVQGRAEPGTVLEVAMLYEGFIRGGTATPHNTKQ